MVKTIRKGKQTWYQCKECGFFYNEKQWAEKCQKWCTKHKSCNLGITAHAVSKQ